MPRPVETLGAVLCLVFALCFAAPNAHADTLFTYMYTASLGSGNSYSWSTEPISAVTEPASLTAAELTAASVTGNLLSGCTITSVKLDAFLVGDQSTFFNLTATLTFRD